MSSGSDSDSSSSSRSSDSSRGRSPSQTSDRNRGWSPDRNYGSPPQRSYGWSPDRNYGSPPQRSYGWSPQRSYGWSPQRSYGWSPQRSRDGSPDGSRRSQSPEKGDYSDRSSSTSPARYRNLWAMGIDPQDYERKWSDPQASTSGTSHLEIEQLSERLSNMQEVKDWMEAGTWKVFENTLAEQLEDELASAKELGVRPLHVDDPGFGKVANEDGKLNWVVTEDGDLLFSPQYVKGEAIAHTVLTNGRPVVAAGEAEIEVYGNERLCTEITNTSGHYRPDVQSLKIGIHAFEVSGITFVGEPQRSYGGDSDGNYGCNEGHDGGNGEHHDITYGYDSDDNTHYNNKEHDLDIKKLSDGLREILAEATQHMSKEIEQSENRNTRMLERAERLEEPMPPEEPPPLDKPPYSDPSNLENLTARSYAERMSNSIEHHLTPKDLEGAWRDLHGDPVYNPNTGGYYDHLGEVSMAMRSIHNAIEEFKDLLEKPGLSSHDRTIIQDLLSKGSKTLDYVEKVINRDQWYPGTKIPFP